MSNHQAIDLAMTEFFFEVVTHSRQQIIHHLVPAGIEQETAIDDLPSLRFLVFGSSSDRVFLGDEVTRTGKRFALPCKAQPAEQFHGAGMVAKNRRRIKCVDQGTFEIVTHDITKKLTSSKRRSSFCPPTGSGRQRLPDLSIAPGSII